MHFFLNVRNICFFYKECQCTLRSVKKLALARNPDADYCTRQPDTSFDANIHAQTNAARCFSLNKC